MYFHCVYVYSGVSVLAGKPCVGPSFGNIVVLFKELFVSPSP